MPAPRVRADYDTLTRMAQSFAQNASNTRQSLQQIKQRLDVLQGGDWIGQGAAAFFREMTSDVLPAFNRLLTSLEQAGQNTKKMSDIMKQAEDEAARFFRLDGGVGAAAAGGAVASEPAGGEGASPAAAATAQAKATREQAKKAAAAGSVALNYTAAALAGASVLSFGAGAVTGVTGIGGLVGVGAGITFGALSAAAWWGATHYQQLANDPPRDDFRIETKFEAPPFDLNPPANEFEATWQELTKQLTAQTLAMKALVTSLERYDGVQLALKRPEGDQATKADQSRHAVAQAGAVAHNAAACAQLAEELLGLQPRVNLAWNQLREDLVSAVAAMPELSPQELKTRYTELQENSLGSLQEGMKLSEEDLSDLRKSLDQRLEAQPLSIQLPEMLFDETWSGTMRAASAELRQLSDSYTRLKTVLQRP